MRSLPFAVDCVIDMIIALYNGAGGETAIAPKNMLIYRFDMFDLKLIIILDMQILC